MSTQQNPTLIPGFEDIMRHIKQQEDQIKKLENTNKDHQEKMTKLYQENQELEEKITCLESDSHNEVSQAEYDELKAENDYLDTYEKQEAKDQIKKLEEQINQQAKWFAEINILVGCDEDDPAVNSVSDLVAKHKKLEAENKKLKEDDKHSENYWRCIMDHLDNPDNPDANFIKPWASEDGLNEEDTEELLNNFGYYPEEEDPTDK